MRDPIREADIERAIDELGQVEVDVTDDGMATTRLKRDHLDVLLTSEGDDAHDDCVHIDDLTFAVAAAKAQGRADALAEIAALAGSAA